MDQVSGADIVDRNRHVSKLPTISGIHEDILDDGCRYKGVRSERAVSKAYNRQTAKVNIGSNIQAGDYQVGELVVLDA